VSAGVTRRIPATARARARASISDEIKAAALSQVQADGAAALSLRAVAREVGMVSSAIYRYFASRDELLTALIVDAYDALGAAAEQGEAAIARRDLRARWLATGRAVRAWALEHPHEYALIHGSPVPGYAAPDATIGPATRVPRLLMGVLEDHHALGGCPRHPVGRIPAGVRTDLRAIQAALATDVPDSSLLAGLAGWTELYGTVSFELFGQFQNVIADRERYFDTQMRRIADDLGL
jgi:AcrR family transcriptional regulator